MALFGKKASTNTRGRSAVFLPFSDAKKIGLLYCWEDSMKEKMVDEFVKSLGADKSVEALCFNPEKKIQPATERAVYSKADFNFFGKTQSAAVIEFSEKGFDYLFHLDFELRPLTQSVLDSSKANWKIGCHSTEGEGIYDLMIKINQSAGLKNLSDQMLIYVNALK